MGKKRNKKYDGLPAKSVIGQIKSGDYKTTLSEITQENIKEIIEDFMRGSDISGYDWTRNGNGIEQPQLLASIILTWLSGGGNKRIAETGL